jgi:hypothetical protein
LRAETGELESFRSTVVFFVWISDGGFPPHRRPVLRLSLRCACLTNGAGIPASRQCGNKFHRRLSADANPAGCTLPLSRLSRQQHTEAIVRRWRRRYFDVPGNCGRFKPHQPRRCWQPRATRLCHCGRRISSTTLPWRRLWSFVLCAI